MEVVDHALVYVYVRHEPASAVNPTSPDAPESDGDHFEPAHDEFQPEMSADEVSAPVLVALVC